MIKGDAHKMHRIYLLAFILILSACGVPSQSNLATPDDKKEEKTIQQLVVDNENVKMTVLNMNKSNSTVTITFDILNKREDSIKIKAEQLSVDDRMVDESIYQLEDEILPHKAANVKLIIQQKEGVDFPEFKNDIEMELYISSLKDPSYVEQHLVNIIY